MVTQKSITPILPPNKKGGGYKGVIAFLWPYLRACLVILRKNLETLFRESVYKCSPLGNALKGK
jgi:hypothetical protein